MGNDANARSVPLLSLVVPAYQVETHLASCLDSILAEADDEIELVVINDGSPDRCPDIIDSYVNHDPRVRAIHLPVNLGAGQARNFGIDSVAGDYVWFVDGDDWLPSGSLPAVLTRLADDRPDVLIIDHAEIADNGQVTPSRPAGLLAGIPETVTMPEHPELLQLAQSACTKIVRRALLNDAKLRFTPGWYEDSIFSHTLMLTANRIGTLNQVCYLYRQWARGITRTASTRHFDVFDQYQRLFERLDGTYPHDESYRPELFRLMIDHYLVIVGHATRLPRQWRRAFFHRIHADFHARLPQGSYPKPTGALGWKHFLVRHNAYRTFAVLRYLYRRSRRGSAKVNALA